MQRLAMIAALLAVPALAGCPSEGGGASTSGATAKPSASTEAVPVTDEDVDKADLPTEEDFEEKAEKDITADTIDDQVDKLASEIEGDEGG